MSTDPPPSAQRHIMYVILTFFCFIFDDDEFSFLFLFFLFLFFFFKLEVYDVAYSA